MAIRKGGAMSEQLTARDFDNLNRRIQQVEERISATSLISQKWWMRIVTFAGYWLIIRVFFRICYFIFWVHFTHPPGADMWLKSLIEFVVPSILM
jgi:hypothetical protein